MAQDITPEEEATRKEMSKIYKRQEHDQNGYDDLAIGRPGSSSYAGEVVEMHGSGGGLSYNSTRTSNDFIGFTAPGDRFAEALATGDFDDDGYKDLLVGSPGHTQFNFTSMGRVYLYRSTNDLTAAALRRFVDHL